MMFRDPYALNIAKCSSCFLADSIDKPCCIRIPLVLMLLYHSITKDSSGKVRTIPQSGRAV